MGCCGSNRAALRVAPRPSAPLPGSPAPGTAVRTPAVSRPQAVRLRWRRRVTASVDGPVSRTRYAVSAEAPVIAVDPRDAVGLLRTGFFERVG